MIVLDETSYHGSSMVIEALAQTIEEAVKLASAKGAKPTSVLVIGDNTVKELKNTYCLAYLCNLVHQGRLQYLGIGVMMFVFHFLELFVGAIMTCALALQGTRAP